jgi:hypothetical protein
MANLYAALLYALKENWPVLPLYSPVIGGCSCCFGDCGSIGKHPRIGDWLNDATTNERQIREWWGQWPSANIGICTGEVSRLLVIDVDPIWGGEKSFESLEKQCGKLPETLRVKTGSRGYHLYFKYPRGLQILSSEKLAGFSGIDVRGNKGYVVAPPSLHKSGRRYRWARPALKPVSLPDSWLKLVYVE